MTLKSTLLERGTALAAQKPWPRIAVDADGWRRAILGLAQGEAVMLGLWSDGEAVHMAVAEGPLREVLVASLACPDKRFPSVAYSHPPAIRLERTIADLYGLT